MKYSIAQNNTIHQVTTNYPPGNHDANHIYKCPISRSEPPANHRYWWLFTLIITPWRSGDNYLVLGHKYLWLAGGYDLNIGLFKWLAWWLPGGWWLFVQFNLLLCGIYQLTLPIDQIYQHDNDTNFKEQLKVIN